MASHFPRFNCATRQEMQDLMSTLSEMSDAFEASVVLTILLSTIMVGNQMKLANLCIVSCDLPDHCDGQSNVGG